MLLRTELIIWEEIRNKIIDYIPKVGCLTVEAVSLIVPNKHVYFALTCWYPVADLVDAHEKLSYYHAILLPLESTALFIVPACHSEVRIDLTHSAHEWKQMEQCGGVAHC